MSRRDYTSCANCGCAAYEHEHPDGSADGKGRPRVFGRCLATWPIGGKCLKACPKFVWPEARSQSSVTVTLAAAGTERRDLRYPCRFCPCQGFGYELGDHPGICYCGHDDGQHVRRKSALRPWLRRERARAHLAAIADDVETVREWQPSRAPAVEIASRAWRVPVEEVVAVSEDVIYTGAIRWPASLEPVVPPPPTDAK